jgi:hypothetical protein
VVHAPSGGVTRAVVQAWLLFRDAGVDCRKILRSVFDQDGKLCSRLPMATVLAPIEKERALQ